MADTAVFDEFVRDRAPSLLRVAYLLTRDHGHAEDLLQTALARSWRAWRSIDGNPEPYVRQVLVNTYATWRGRRWHAERPSEVLPEPALVSPHGQVDDRDQVWRALDRLPRQQRAVLVLRYFEDLPEAQIAAALGIAVGSVKSSAARALATLRLDESLRPDFLDVPPAPPVERVAAVRQRIARQRRRRLATVAAACVAVVLLVLAYAIGAHLLSLHGAHEPISPVVGSSALARIYAVDGLPIGGRFIDANNAVLLVGHCQNLEAAEECSASVEATSDGGATFQKRTMPIEGGLLGVSLYVFDARHLVLDRPQAIDIRHLSTQAGTATLGPPPLPSGLPTDYPTDLPPSLPSGLPTYIPSDLPSEFPTDSPTGFNLPTLAAARFASSDGGRTWSSVSTTPSTPVIVIPDGAQVIKFEPSYIEGPLIPAPPVASVMTSDGVAHPITNAAPQHWFGTQTFGSPYSGGLDGCYFLSVQDPVHNFNQTGLVVSPDQGRTWHNTGITADGLTLAPLGAGGGRLFVTTSETDDPGSFRVYLSTDHGSSWTRVDPPPGRARAASVGPTAAVLNDGGLLYSDGTHLWKLDANAMTLRRVDGDGVTTYYVGGLGRLAFGIRSDGADTVILSTTGDGTNWRTMSLVK